MAEIAQSLESAWWSGVFCAGAHIDKKGIDFTSRYPELTSRFAYVGYTIFNLVPSVFNDGKRVRFLNNAVVDVWNLADYWPAWLANNPSLASAFLSGWFDRCSHLTDETTTNFNERRLLLSASSSDKVEALQDLTATHAGVYLRVAKSALGIRGAETTKRGEICALANLLHPCVPEKRALLQTYRGTSDPVWLVPEYAFTDLPAKPKRQGRQAKSERPKTTSRIEAIRARIQRYRWPDDE